MSNYSEPVENLRDTVERLSFARSELFVAEECTRNAAHAVAVAKDRYDEACTNLDKSREVRS